MESVEHLVFIGQFGSFGRRGRYGSMWRFHLLATDDDGQPKHYHGHATEEAAAQLEIRLNSHVRAVLTVVETDSEFLPEPEPIYRLNTIDPL